MKSIIILLLCSSLSSFVKGEDSASYFYGLTNDINSSTAEEVDAFNSLKSIFLILPTVGTTEEYSQARKYVDNLNANTAIEVNEELLMTTGRYLEILSISTLPNEDSPRFQKLLEYLISEKIVCGQSAFRLKSNSYSHARKIPTYFLSILSSCTANEYSEVMDFLRLITEYGRIYDADYLSNLNSDIIYNYLPHYFGIAVNNQNAVTGTGEFKAIKRFLERNTEYTLGALDILKPDGTGFHHNTQYNNYMYCYRSWVEYIYLLKDTPFKIELPAYERLKKAILAEYAMATKGTDGQHLFANTLCGRNPFGSGIQLQFNADLLRRMADVGLAVTGTRDEEIAAAYNYYYNETYYSNTSAEFNFEGFYQYNYGHLGIYRKGNWVATMHAPTNYSWGAEIYSNENRFGRFQSHGAMEILYEGDQTESGYPEASIGGAGWDWNVIPGTTTIHISLWKSLMPGQNLTQRFDQYSRTNFSGALSMRNSGMFACDFDQSNAWGEKEVFPMVGLFFKKTVFAFGKYLFCLGTDISSYGNTDKVATNLFQHIITDKRKNLYVNGELTEQGNSKTLYLSDKNAWVIAPSGTGYFIPKGNDNLQIDYKEQSSPSETGINLNNPVTTIAAKAYLNHSKSPSDRKYLFIAVPNATISDMAQLSESENKGEENLYRVESDNASLHALSYLPDNTTAYAFFEPTYSKLIFGRIKESNVPQLLMVKEEEGKLRLAACDPSMDAQADENSVFFPQPVYVSIVVDGKWELADKSVDVTAGSTETETTVRYTLSEGMPVYFDLIPFGSSASVDNQMDASYAVFCSNGTLFIKGLQHNESYIVYNIGGTIRMMGEGEGVEISQKLYSKGIYIVKLRTTDGDKIFKITNV